MTNNVYDILKKLAQVGLPAIITFYATLGTTWGWPAIEQVVASLGAFNVFLGVVLGISSSRYSASGTDDAVGSFEISIGGDTPRGVINLPLTIEEIANKDRIVLSVNQMVIDEDDM